MSNEIKFGTHIIIDGHPLPESLNEIVVRGDWRAPSDRKKWDALISPEHVVQPLLYPLDKVNGRSLWASEAGDNFIGVEDANLRPGKLDPANAIIIGDLGPERFLALDLRVSKSNPTVCAYLPRDDEESCWVQIAPSLEEFLDKLGLAIR